MRFVRSFVLILIAASAFAQGLPTASLTGRVTSDGTALPGVTVTVKSPNLQGSRSAVTNDAGLYVFHLLPPGQYTVAFELSGMHTVQRKAVLAAAASERIDVALQAAAAERITVVATAPVTGALETSQVGANFDKELINELPVSRDVTSITLLSPGVTNNGVGGAVMISGAMSF